MGLEIDQVIIPSTKSAREQDISLMLYRSINIFNALGSHLHFKGFLHSAFALHLWY